MNSGEACRSGGHRWWRASLFAALLVAATEGEASAETSARIPPPTLTGLDAERARVAEQQRMLSSLWAFATLNYLYCDVVGLMDSKMLKQYESGRVGGVNINEKFLLGATIFMQVPMSMVFLSTSLSPRASRVANIAAGSLMTTVQAATLFVGKPTSYYLFSSAVEIATTGFITAYSIFYMKPPRVVPGVEVGSGHFAMKLGVSF